MRTTVVLNLGPRKLSAWLIDVLLERVWVSTKELTRIMALRCPKIWRGEVGSHLSAHASR